MARKRRPLAALAIALGAISSSIASSARADDGKVAHAQALFDEALVLMKAKRYAEACPKLEESDTLDPGMGTEYRLGECYEADGKIASAWSTFSAVSAAAKRDGKIERSAVAGRRAALLLPRLPRILLDVPDAARAPGLEVLQDGKSIAPSDWAGKMPIDPGAHVISARAPGKIGWSTSATFVERATTTVPVPALGDLPTAPRAVIVVVAPPPPRPGMPTPRKIALAAGGLGVAGVVIGTVFGLRARSQWSSAQATCVDPAIDRGCTSAGNQLSRDALTSAAVSTVGFAVAGAAVVAAGVLWFSARPPTYGGPAASLRISPVVGPGVAEARIEGSF
jgi:hypothetical protein